MIRQQTLLKKREKRANQHRVIDLTEFSNLGAKKPSKATAEPIITATPTPTPIKTDGEKLTVEVGKDEKAKGEQLTDEAINTPINPLEPFTRYKRPTLSLLTKDENDGKPYIDMDEIKAYNEEIIKVLKSFGIEIREIKATVGPTITLYEITWQRAFASQRYAISKTTSRYAFRLSACVSLHQSQARALSVLRCRTKSAIMYRWRVF